MLSYKHIYKIIEKISLPIPNEKCRDVYFDKFCTMGFYAIILILINQCKAHIAGFDYDDLECYRHHDKSKGYLNNDMKNKYSKNKGIFKFIWCC